MAPAVHVVFPNQLYDPPIFPAPDGRRQRVVLVEEPLFFHDAERRPHTPHKLKLAFLRAAMRQYAAAHPGLEYVEHADAPALFARLRSSSEQVSLHYPHDREVLRRYRELVPARRLRVLEDPCHFVGVAPPTTQRESGTERETPSCPPAPTGTRPHRPVGPSRDPTGAARAGRCGSRGRSVSLRAVYGAARARLGVLVGQPSTDRQNRRRLPRGHAPAPRPEYGGPAYDEAAAYVSARFARHPGGLEGLRRLPTTHAGARAHLARFLRERFARFGPYQDAVHDADPVVYHAHVSYLLNCGLLQPRDVALAAARAARRGRVPLSSLEGFVRQLLGWREYMRAIYEAHHDELAPLFADARARLPQAWYDGTTGVAPLDAEIRKLHAEAWAHHIVRLMLFLNYLVLDEQPPAAICRWFSEMVALDAYEWVMWSNIAAMGFFDGRFTRKPYLSSSAYVRRMSNYAEDGSGWAARWDALFYGYLRRHEAALVGKRAVLRLALLALRRQPRGQELLEPSGSAMRSGAPSSRASKGGFSRRAREDGPALPRAPRRAGLLARL